MTMTLLDFKINVNHLNRAREKEREKNTQNRHEMTLSEINHYLRFNQIEKKKSEKKKFRKKFANFQHISDQQFNHLENKLTQIIQRIHKYIYDTLLQSILNNHFACYVQIICNAKAYFISIR